MCNCNQRELELIPELEQILGEYQDEFELAYETAPTTCTALPSAKQMSAVKANRTWAKLIGWGCLKDGKVEAVEKLYKFLKFTSVPTEEALACAIADWQVSKKVNATGILDKRTWDAMNVIKKLAFPQAWDIYFMGNKLGVLEKTTPYVKCYTGSDGICHLMPTSSSVSGGVEIEFGFRITDMDAVKKAGFIDDKGLPVFRFVQVIETNRRLDQGTQTLIKKYSKYVDPNPTTGKFDKHPYYWNEKGEGPDVGLQVQTYTNYTSTSNNLCYDLVFYDRPSRPLSEATTGKRVFWNAEAALIGVRKGKRNVILDSFTWGFDIVVSGGKPEIKRNGLNKGVRGGSQKFRKIVNDAILAGQFPGHCFFGPGFSGVAVCK